MPSSHTPNLGIEKPAPGEQEGTWGGTVNTDFDLFDQAICGIEIITLVSAGTTGAPNTMPITESAVSEGRNKHIEYTDGGDLLGNVYVQLTSTGDLAEKVVYIKNNLSGGRDLYLFQGTYDAARDYVVRNKNTAVVKFDGKGATSSSCTAVFSTMQVDGLELPNDNEINWQNAAGDNTLTIKYDAGDDLLISALGTTIMQYDSSLTRWILTGEFESTGILVTAADTQLTVGDAASVFGGTVAATNLSGTNTGNEPTFTGSTAGVVPTSLGGTTNYLRADGTWAAPPGGTASPLTTKGDLYCFSTVNARLPVGTNGYVLSADSSTATGLKWIVAGTGGLGNVVEDTSPQLGGDLDSNNFNISLANTGVAKQVRFYEPIGGGASYAAIQAAAMASTWTLTLPPNAGTNLYVLQTNGAGVTSWVAQTSSQIPAILSNGSVPTLNTGITGPEVRSLIGAGTGNGSVTSVSNGNGMNFTSFSTSGTITLGTPGSCTATSTNGVTTSSHTHVIDSTIARIASPVFTGTVTAPVFNATSARDKKTEVISYINPDGVLLLKPITYTLNDDPDKKAHLGLFADEVEMIYPEVVGNDETGKAISIDYSRLVIPLLLKVQEQEERLRAAGL